MISLVSDSETEFMKAHKEIYLSYMAYQLIP